MAEKTNRALKSTMGNWDPDKLLNPLEEAHEAHESRDGRREVKYPFAFKNHDWNEYHRYRPRYPDSMFKMWLSYHREHGGKFQWAHDIGAGPGTVARRIATRFDRIVVSDAGRNNIASAKENLASPDPSKYIFLHSPAESVAEMIPKGSIDFTSVAMAFHYFDAPAAIRAIAATLRPGGTLAVVTYGFRLRFPGRPALEHLWYRVASNESLRLLREGGLFPAAVRGLAAAMAGLDSVPLPTELFEPGARRILVNTDEADARPPLCFVDEDPSCWEPAPDRVGRADVRRRVRDGGWRREADAAWLRGFLVSCQMGFGDKTWATEEWRRLEELVAAAAGGRVTIEWPVAMILATRNRRPVQGG